MRANQVEQLAEVPGEPDGEGRDEGSTDSRGSRTDRAVCCTTLATTARVAVAAPVGEVSRNCRGR